MMCACGSRSRSRNPAAAGRPSRAVRDSSPLLLDTGSARLSREALRMRIAALSDVYGNLLVLGPVPADTKPLAPVGMAP